MTLAPLGLALGIGVYAAAVFSLNRAARTAIDTAPASWGERFGDAYADALALRLRDLFVSTRTLWALDIWIAVLVVLQLFDVSLVVQLGSAVAYAAWATESERRTRRDEIEQLVAQGLEPLARNRRLTLWYDGSLYAMWVGFLCAACFLVQVIAELVHRPL